MATKTDILIPELGGKIAEVVAKSLRKHGLEVAIFDDSRFGKDEMGYLRELRKAISELQPAAVMPIFRGECLAREWCRTSGTTSAPLLCESAEKIALLDDKVTCSDLVKDLGIPQPRMYKDEEVEAIGKWPVVFKRARGLSGSSVYFPKDRKALDNLIRSCIIPATSRRPEIVRPHLIMDYIKGYNVSVDAFRWAKDGEVHFEAIAYRTLWPVGKGISKVRIRVRRPQLIDYARRILDSVDYNGVCGLDFRKAYFLECNPRFSGGLRTSLAAGLDLPWLLWTNNYLKK